MPAGTGSADEVGEVPLGYDAAWGFARPDQTSPARAGAMDALVDVGLHDQPVTELRIHGVSGSNGPTMLEHPTALQVGGDNVAGFFRRWSPGGQGRASVPWKLEAYSWGGLTEKPLASASWLLLAPFMMYNVAHFMLPPQAIRPGQSSRSGQPGQTMPRRDPGHWTAQALIRLLALAATAQLATGAATVAVSTAAWQAGREGLLPSWMGWYADLSTGWRMAVALGGVVALLVLLWVVSAATASRYESRITTATPEQANAWPLSEPGFWRGERLVRRQRSLHIAVGGSAAAMIVALPAERLTALRDAAVGLAIAVLITATVMVLLPLADRHSQVKASASGGSAADGSATDEPAPDGPAPDWPARGCRLTALAAAVAVVLAALAAGLGDPVSGARRGPLPGLTGFTLGLISVQLALLIALAVTVIAIIVARKAAATRQRTAPQVSGAAGRAFAPYCGGGLSVVFAVLAFCLGWQFTVLLNLGVARLLGSPVPGGFKFDATMKRVFDVPWPVFAAGAGAFGVAAGVILAGITIAVIYLRLRRQIATGRAPGISISDAYAGRGGADVGQRGRRRIAGVWAIAQLAERVTLPVLLLVGSWLIAIVGAEVAMDQLAGTSAHPFLLMGSGWLHGAASFVAVSGALTAAIFLLLLRSDIRSESDRRVIGALWDVATFWPRAAHPLAPPCYAERAVPEVVDRIRLITGSADHAPDDPVRLLRHAEQPDLVMSPGLTVPTGPVLLTGYSQGTVIAIAVAAQLPKPARDQIALLTLACPARRLYGRAFPAYFGPGQLESLRELLDGPAGEPGYRWRNVVRRSDYIGSWIFSDPLDHLADEGYDRLRWLGQHVDQACWDPVVLVPDADPTPPPVNRHAAWWQDPRAGQVAELLVKRLTRQVPASGPARPWWRRPR